MIPVPAAAARSTKSAAAKINDQRLFTNRNRSIKIRAAFDKKQRVEEKSNPGICIREKRRYLHCRAVLEAF